MSLHASRWAWDQCLSSSQKLILLSLADRANDKNTCYPSVNRLTKDTCLNRKTILSSLNKLEKNGLISIKKHNGSSNYYTLNTKESSTKIGTSTKTNTGTKSGTGEVPKPVPPPVPKPVPKPINNLSLNLPIYINAELFNEFWMMRKKLKAVNSEKALQLLITKLGEFKNNGDDPNKAIERSIENSWKSIFPDRSVNNETNRHTSKPKSKHEQFWDRTKARLAAPT